MKSRQECKRFQNHGKEFQMVRMRTRKDNPALQCLSVYMMMGTMEAMPLHGSGWKEKVSCQGKKELGTMSMQALQSPWW